MTDADKLRKLIAEATPGKWYLRRNDEDDGSIHYDIDVDAREVACVRHPLPYDARLIVLLRAVSEPLAEWMEAALNPSTTAAQLDSAEVALLSALSAALKEQQS